MNPEKSLNHLGIGKGSSEDIYKHGQKKIRFEMPYDVWCLGCKIHIGMGVRYNAEKAKVDKYYSTDIFQFRMKCRSCGNVIEIRTDPKRFDYSIIRGIARKASEKDDIPEIEDVEEEQQDSDDPMYKLERELEDKRKAEEQRSLLERTRQWRSTMQDDFGCNRIIRRQYREERKRREKLERDSMRLQAKASLKIPILPPDSRERGQARKLIAESTNERLTRIEKRMKAKILTSPIKPNKEAKR